MFYVELNIWCKGNILQTFFWDIKVCISFKELFLILADLDIELKFIILIL